MMLRDSKLRLQPSLPPSLVTNPGFFVRKTARLIPNRNSVARQRKKRERTRRRRKSNDRDDGSGDSKKRSETVIKDRARTARAWRASRRESN